MARQKIDYKRYYKVEKEAREESERKYWKLQERFSFWFPLGIIALLLMIGLFVYAIWNIWPHSTAYTIYKNECHNETDIALETSCESYCDWYEYIGTHARCVAYCQNNLTKVEVCNKTEVDSIEYKLDCNTQDYNKKDYPLECIKALMCFSDCISYQFDYIPMYKDDPPKQNIDECTNKCLPKIDKKDINLKWLDNNCIPSYCLTSDNVGLCQVDSKVITQKIDSWKCGEYGVEVK